MITIIGNGENRKEINISRINGIKIGCNAVYLYEKVDMLCAVDKFWRDKIVKETTIPLISRLHNTAMQTTLELFNKGWSNTDCPYRGYCSGITALDYVAHTTNDSELYLIGFDFDYQGNTVNHMYKDKPFHPKSNRPAQNECIFLRQFLETAKRYPLKTFYWVSDSEVPIGLKNIKTLPIEDYILCAYN